MNTRIKAIRNALQLSQREFGARLGVSRDVISNIEYGRVLPKDLLIQHLCTQYSVNEQWLRCGTGSMFLTPPDEQERVEKALEIFQSLSPEFQDCALAQLKQLVALQNKEGRENKPKV